MILNSKGQTVKEWFDGLERSGDTVWCPDCNQFTAEWSKLLYNWQMHHFLGKCKVQMFLKQLRRESEAL